MKAGCKIIPLQSTKLMVVWPVWAEKKLSASFFADSAEKSPAITAAIFPSATNKNPKVSVLASTKRAL
ncbi:MAG: hypothetical protein IJ441_00410 [Spirochaetaceae bacterium]|nr:hypothetical protein [Spirochaetaceae bacterium]